MRLLMTFAPGSPGVFKIIQLNYGQDDWQFRPNNINFLILSTYYENKYHSIGGNI
jgi:hypothetical protein